MKRFLITCMIALSAHFQLDAQCLPGEQQVVFEIAPPGSFAGEISWKLIEDVSGTEVFAQPAGFLNNPGEDGIDTLCLVTGAAYRFEAYDDFGDGWNGANYSLAYLDGFVFKTAAPDNGTDGGGQFELEETYTFTVGDRPGDDCTLPSPLEVGGSYQVNTLQYSNAYTTNPLFDSGTEVVYEFIPPLNDNYNFALSLIAQPVRSSIQLFEGCLDNSPVLLEFDSTGTTTNNISVSSALNSGTSYYVVISNNADDTGVNSTSGQLDVSFSGPPSNTVCAQSVNLTLDAAPIGGRLPTGEIIESITLQDGYGNTYTSGDEVLYYDFNLAATEDVVISLEGFGEQEAVFIQMAKQLNCGELEEDTYRRVSLFGANKKFAFDGLTAGNYILKVFSDQSLSTTDPFTISLNSFATMPSATNQDCSTAIEIQSEQACTECSPSSSVPFFSTFNGSNSGLGAPCAQDSIYSAAASDIWVKTQAPSSGSLIVETYGEIDDAFSTPESAIETRFSAYTGTCGALNEVFCSNDFSNHQMDTISGLVAGEMVYIRLFDRNGDDEGDVGIRFIAEEALPYPSTSVAFTSPTAIDLTNSDFYEGNYSYQKGFLVSADSFQTFVTNYDPAFIAGTSTSITFSGLEPATKYYVKVWNQNGILNNSDTATFEVRTSAYEISSLVNGNWSDPNIWSSGTVPPADSAVLISHKVTINPGEAFTTFKATINNNASNLSGGIWMQGGDLNVTTNLEVLDNGGSTTYDSLGVFINTTGSDSANLNVGERLTIDKGNALVDFPLQLIAINNGLGINVTVGDRFEFLNVSSDSTTIYGDNIYFENAILDVGQHIVLNSQYVPSSQPLRARFLNSDIYTANFDLNGSSYNEGKFSVRFTGSTSLHLGNSMQRNGDGGKIRFSDQSTLFIEGSNTLSIAGYSVGQDSVIYNDVVINLVNNDPDDYVEVRSSGTALEADMIINGDLSLINGKIGVSTANSQGYSNRLLISENGTISGGNKDSYVIGKLAKRGNSNFNFPVGHTQQFTPVAISNIGGLLPSDVIEIAAINNYCGDSILTTPVGIARLKTEEFWELNAIISDPNNLIDIQPYFPSLEKAGITSLPALRLTNLSSNIDLGNIGQTDSSFAATYDFNNGTSVQIGVGTADANENPFYYKKDVESISAYVAAPGDQVTITYTGSFASANDVVYFGDVPATTVGATANSIDVTIPAGARSGDVVIDTEFAGVLYVNLAMTISNPTSTTANNFNYNVLTDYNDVSNAADLTNAVMKFGQIDGDGSLDAMFVIPETDSVKVVSGIGLSSQMSGFRINSEGILLKPLDVELKLSNILKANSAYDAAFKLGYQSATGLGYLKNDGLGAFSLLGEVNIETGSYSTSLGIKDVEYDGVSDLFYSASDPDSQLETVVFTRVSEFACNAILEPSFFIEFNDLQMEEIIYGNFDGASNPNFMYLIDGQSRFGVGSLYSTGPSNAVYSESARAGGQIADVRKASLTGDSFHQVVASNQITNEIEVYSYNGTSINKQSFALSFTPGALAIDDLNGDGYQDVVVSSQDESALQIMFASNDGSGGLVSGDFIQYPGALIVDFEIADIDFDSNKDFVLFRGDGRLSIAFYQPNLEVTAPTVTASNITTSAFDLTWDSVAFAPEYEIFISLENDTIPSLASDSIFLVSDTALTFNAPIPFETYYVFGRSISIAGDTSNFSSPVAVNLLTLDSMSFQAENLTTSTFDLRWSSVISAAEYEIFISLENDTIPSLASDSTFLVSDTVLTFNAPIPFETYYVYGRSISSAGDTSNFSNPIPFDLLRLDSLNFQSQNISYTGFDLAWGAVTNAGSYEVVISLQNNPNAGLVSDSIFQVSDTSIAFNAPVDFENYYVFGRAISAQGDSAEFANSFVVQLESIQVPEPIANNSNSNGFDLSWTQVAGADQYQVYVGLNADTTSIGENDSVFIVSSEIVSYQAPEYSELYYFFVKAISNTGDTSAFSLVDSVKLPVSTYLEQDSLAMVALYQTNGGNSWTNNLNWLTGKMNTWEGLEMNADSLFAINLPSNQLNGILPNDLGSLNFITDLDLSNNTLTDVSVLVGQANNLNSLNLSGNALNFEQLEDLSAVPNFIYSNQDFVYDLPLVVFENLGTDISIVVEASAAQNTFQWYKDSEQIVGATNPTLNLINAQRADEGLYYVEINNALLPELTLQSNITEVKISSLERDVVALRQFYESTNGNNWSTIIWDTTSDNPIEWSGNNQDIIVEDNRVVEINLPENNLTGSIPSALNEVLGLRSVDLSNNAIEDVADLTALPNLTELNLSGNALGFDDLEINVSVQGFVFDDQASFGNATEQKIPQGSDFTLSYEVEGSANIYEWYRNDELVNNADTSEFTIDSIIFETMGEYRLVVSNTIINSINSDFVLNSNPVNIMASATIAGNVQDANEFTIESGRVYLFDDSYDTVRLENGNFFQNIQGDGSFELQNIALGDYSIYINNDENNYPNLLNTYYQSTIDWELADVVNLRSNIDDLSITMEGEPQELAGTSVLSGYLEEEFEEGQRMLPRRRVSGAGVSVRTLAGSSRDISFRSILENGELVAYLETDEDGEFEIPNIPAGSYTIKFDLPGVPMNEQSDINFDLTGEDQEALEISAVSDNGQISVTRVKYTANRSELIKNVTVYPNPSNGRFKIAGAGLISSIKIISTEGRLIQELSDFNNPSQGVDVDLSNYPDGMYFMQVVWEDGLRSMNKLIKE